MDSSYLPAHQECQLETMEVIIEHLFLLHLPTPILTRKLRQLELYVNEIPSQCLIQAIKWERKLASWWDEYSNLLLHFKNTMDAKGVSCLFCDYDN